MKPFRPALSAIDPAANRQAQLERIKRNIIDVPDPVEDTDGTWSNNGGERRTYHGWMLETRAEILGLLREWPDYAPILKIRLANAVYHKAVFGQIAKAFYENTSENDDYTKTHPMLMLEEAGKKVEGGNAVSSTIYGAR